MIKKIISFTEFLNEDNGGGGAGSGDASGGVGFSTLAGNGMGNIAAPQASSIPGFTAGSTIGSGDIPAYNLINKFKSPSYKKKGKVKNKKVKYFTKK